MSNHSSAFPVIPPQDENSGYAATGYPSPQSGMSLRQYFAGEAMKGYLSGMDTSIVFDQIALAEDCFRMADAMLIAGVTSP